MLPRLVARRAVIIVRWAATHQKTVKLALEELADRRRRTWRVWLLTRVDIRKREYDFGDSRLRTVVCAIFTTD